MNEFYLSIYKYLQDWFEETEFSHKETWIYWCNIIQFSWKCFLFLKKKQKPKELKFSIKPNSFLCGTKTNKKRLREGVMCSVVFNRVVIDRRKHPFSDNLPYWCFNFWTVATNEVYRFKILPLVFVTWLIHQICITCWY